MTLINRLKTVRLYKGETQQQVADVLNTAREQYNKYETGKHELPAYRLAILCQHWQVSANWILGIEEYGPPKTED